MTAVELGRNAPLRPKATFGKMVKMGADAVLGVA
jgi:hypothetical protein